MKERHIMLDIETLGNGSNACVVSIGAVEFFPIEGRLGREFEVIIDPEDSEKYGEIDASTVKWWLKQCTKAQDATFPKSPSEYITLGDALFRLGIFVNTGPGPLVGVWGNGATFDNVILHNMYKRVGQPAAWSFRMDMDFRTLRYLERSLELDAPDPMEKGVAHRALDDAIWQAYKACAILRALRHNHTINEEFDS